VSEDAAASPNVPTLRPRHIAPIACAQSSINTKPRAPANLDAWQRPLQRLYRTPATSGALADIFESIFQVTDRLHFDLFRDKLCTLVPAAEPTIMTIAEQLRREGLTQGRVEEIQRVLRMLITEKFGALPRKHQSRIAKASLADLERWAKRLLRATTLDDVFA
jgi:hypothetical protein